MYFNYAILGINFLTFWVFNFRYFYDRIDKNIFDVKDQIKIRKQQILNAVFLDSSVLNIYILSFLKIIPIDIGNAYYMIQYFFLLSNLFNIKINDNLYFVFVQLLNVGITSYFTYGLDPFLGYLLRFLCNFMNRILMEIINYRIDVIEKERVIIYNWTIGQMPK